MSTTTAHILIGRSHPYHYCIRPTHVLTLHENSRPLLVLRPYPVTMPERLPDGVAPPGEVHWVPTLKHMFEDALLMVACHTGFSLTGTMAGVRRATGCEVTGHTG